MLKGDLANFSLGEIFQSLAINNHTGTLKISAPGLPTKLLYFEHGEITLFSSGLPGVPRLGQMLIHAGKLTPEELKALLDEQKETKELLGEMLLRKGLVTPEGLKEALERKVLEQICDLFLLKEGHFEFHMEYFPEEVLDDLQKKTRIALNTNSVIMEGLRRLDEWGVIQKHIKTLNEIPARTDSTGTDTGNKIAAYLMAQLNGARTVRELFNDAPAGNFECAKYLHELIEAGHVRLLTIEELKTLSTQCVTQRQFPQAASYLQSAVEIDPADPDLQTELGDALAGYYQDEAALACYLKSYRLYLGRGDHAKATEVGEKILKKGSLEEPDLEKLMQAYLQLKDTRRAASIGGQLVTLLQRKGEGLRAALTLENLSKLEPDDLPLKLQVATLFDKAGDKAKATSHLEEAAAALGREKKHRELIKVLRLLLQVSPSRQEIKDRIASIQALQEKYERRRRRRITLAGAVTIVLLVLAFMPILYEIKSRECFGHAQRLEQISMMTMDFGKAKSAYEELLQSYGLSTRAEEARTALRRISEIEKGLVDRLERENNLRMEAHEAKMLQLRRSFATAVESASEAEKRGDLKLAHEVYRKVKAEFAELPAAQDLLFPVRIETDPPGAVVVIDGKETMQTPFLYRYKPGVTLQLSITRSSCNGIQKTIELTDQWELKFTMQRRTVATYTPVMALQQPMVSLGQIVIFPSREGSLYAVDAFRKTVLWQRAVGRFGDRVSNLRLHGEEIYMGVVTSEVTAISVITGKSRWIARTSSSVLAAPAVSEDGKWVAVGTTNGSVEVLNNQTGSIVAKFTTENEILASPIFVGDLVLAGSTDNCLYGYSMQNHRLEFVEELSDDILVDLCAWKDKVIVATADGKVHLFDTALRKVVWSQDFKVQATWLGAGPSGIHLGTSDGSLVTLDPGTGGKSWSLSLGGGAVSGVYLGAKSAYVCLDSGKTAVVDLAARRVAWDYQSEKPIVIPPVVAGKYLHIGSVLGKIELIEVFE